METSVKIARRLQSLINEIQTNNRMNSETLIQLIKGSDLKENDLIPFSNFNHEVSLSYGRTKIFEGSNFVIYLMSWAKGDYTAIHNHGFTDWGAVYFPGEISHRLYKLEDMTILLANTSLISPGTIVPVNGSLIHAMGNLSDEPVVSLHIYGSDNSIGNSNTGSHIYEIEKKHIRTTHGEAYLNGNENIEEAISGLTTNSATLEDYFTVIRHYYQRNNLTEMSRYIDSILANQELYFNYKNYLNWQDR